MKAIELPAFRAFMFAVVPQLYHAQPVDANALEAAIAEAAYLWDAIDMYVLEVAKKLEND